jgi:hypothetical protein
VKRARDRRRRKDAIGVALIVAQIGLAASYVAWAVHEDHVHGISVAEDLATVGL